MNGNIRYIEMFFELIMCITQEFKLNVCVTFALNVLNKTFRKQTVTIVTHFNYVMGNSTSSQFCLY